MGIKEREFGPLPPVSLEDLVPPDHFYRHLERTLDLAFVRELVRGTYAEIGRPSLDPVVFFKLQLILFFEGLRSERQLLRVVADRLSRRWYLGDDLTEPLPDHSSLTRLRERYGLDVFRRFSEQIVAQCIEAGLLWGTGLHVDATRVAANASLDSLTPRFAVEAHLATLLAGSEAGGRSGGDEDEDGGDKAEEDGSPAPTPLPIHLTEAARGELARLRPRATTGSVGQAVRTGARSAGTTGARPIFGSARPIRTPRRCGGPTDARTWASTTTTSSTEGKPGSSWPRW